MKQIIYIFHCLGDSRKVVQDDDNDSRMLGFRKCVIASLDLSLNIPMGRFIIEKRM